MYEQHFGLKSRPFRSNIDASGVFVGPAQAKVMANLKKALAASDAVVTVTGPVGIGKTTVVNRALESISNKRVIARVGRMQLAADEVLELLLTEFDVSRQPNGTIQRFAAFRRLLHDWAVAGTRAFIVVEDAQRIGLDALIELEALTAADNGDGIGASIVLMGPPSLAELVSAPPLARLRQRIRLRQTAAAFSEAEVRGYLKHCIRNAGGDFDEIFDQGAVDMLFRCSEGVPRVVNNLCESVLAAAAEANAALVLPQLVQHVAQEEFGILPLLPALANPKPGPAQVPARQAEPDGEPHAPLKSALESSPNSDSTPAPAMSPGLETDSRRDVAPKVTPATTDETVTETTTAAADDTDRNAVSTTQETIPVQSLPAAEKIDDSPQASAGTQFEPMPVSAFSAEPERHQSVAARSGPLTRDTTGKKIGQPSSPAAEPMPEEDIDSIPELIQDTQPKLTTLTVEDDLPDLTDLIAPVGKAPVRRPAEPTRLSTLNDIPTLTGDMKIHKSAEPVPTKKTRVDHHTVPDTVSGKGKSDRPAAQKKAGIDHNTAPEAAMRNGKSAEALAHDEVDPKVEATITEIPDWDRDPTFAELRPDIAALEKALAVVPEPVAKKTTGNKIPQPETRKSAAPKEPFDLPEITLEKELQVKETAARELLRKSAPVNTHEPDADAPARRTQAFDLDRIAAELGKARSLEDVDDKLAETLFGEEMANAAAEVAAMVAADEAAAHGAGKASGNALTPPQDAMPATREAGPAELPAAPGTTRPPTVSPASTPAAKPSEQAAAKTPATGQVKVPAAGQVKAPPTAQAKASLAPDVPSSIEITLQTAPDAVMAPAGPTPEPIEEQFGPSMTATLKALSAAQVQKMDESANDEEDKAPRRLFGLFRGST
jgi:type II secretory pathway predicted ATPase ExeA